MYANFECSQTWILASLYAPSAYSVKFPNIGPTYAQNGPKILSMSALQTAQHAQGLRSQWKQLWKQQLGVFGTFWNQKTTEQTFCHCYQYPWANQIAMFSSLFVIWFQFGFAFAFPFGTLMILMFLDDTSSEPFNYWEFNAADPMFNTVPLLCRNGNHWEGHAPKGGWNMWRFELWISNFWMYLYLQ